MENGLVLYNIELHNCLNGVYTNDGCRGEIFNEIARLKIDCIIGEDGLSGDYDCFYFDIDNSRQGSLLKITAVANGTIDAYTYNFEWLNINNTLIFVGVGYKMNEKQIAVHYRNA